MEPSFDQKTHLDPKVSVHDEELSGTTAVNGDAIDCKDYDGLIYADVIAGAATGSPTSFTATGKLQESADGSTGWTDLSNQDTGVLSADNTAVKLRGHRTTRYVRVVVTPAFTGGSSPTLPGVHGVVQGQKRRA